MIVARLAVYPSIEVSAIAVLSSALVTRRFLKYLVIKIITNSGKEVVNTYLQDGCDRLAKMNALSNDLVSIHVHIH